MAVTFTSRTRVGRNAWRLTWSSDAAAGTLFRVVVNGREVAGTRLNHHTVELADDESALVEVLDDDLPATLGHSPRLQLEWAAVAGTREYLVEQSIAAVWTQVARVRQDHQTRIRWLSGPLADVTSHSFRVSAVGESNNTASPVTVTREIVRHPDPPRVTLTGNVGRTVTIAAA